MKQGKQGTQGGRRKQRAPKGRQGGQAAPQAAQAPQAPQAAPGAQAAPWAAQVPQAAQQVVTPTHERAGLRLLARAIHGGWDLAPELLRDLPRVATHVVATARNDRERLRAIEVLVAMQRDNLAALQVADKVERLDGGQPTELVQLAPITLVAGGGAGG